MGDLTGWAARAAETEAIVAVLHEEGFDDDEQDPAAMAEAARALLRASVEILLARDWYVIASQDGPDDRIQLKYGFFATEAGARKALDGNTLGLMGRAGILRIASAHEREGRVLEWLQA